MKTSFFEVLFVVVLSLPGPTYLLGTKTKRRDKQNVKHRETGKKHSSFKLKETLAKDRKDFARTSKFQGQVCPGGPVRLQCSAPPALQYLPLSQRP